MTDPDLTKAHAAGYWSALCPDASITDDLQRRVGNAYPVPTTTVDDWKSQLRLEGYFQTGPLVPQAELTLATSIVRRVVDAGLPGPFAFVYDELWLLVHRLANVLQAALGPDFMVVPDFWVWCVDDERALVNSHPHRDDEVCTPFDTHGRPTIVTLWLPLTEATPQNSCIYALPKHLDPRLDDGTLDWVIDTVDLPSVRALPAPPGSALCWDQHLLHWGSRTVPPVSDPRISLGIYAQRGDTSPLLVQPLAANGSIPLADRLGWIGSVIQKYPKGIPHSVLEFCRHSQLLLLAVEEATRSRATRMSPRTTVRPDRPGG